MTSPSPPRRFATTQWSLVIQAGSDEASQTQVRRALGELCRTYWYPLYAFVRSRGYSSEDAQDLTQTFFTRIIETRGLASADREQGRFRSYLLGALKHFLTNEWHRSRTQKRGGQWHFVQWDSLDPESRYAETAGRSDQPEHLFDREWAVETVAAALRALRDEMDRAGKGDQFELLKGSLTGEDPVPRRELAVRLHMSEGAVKVAVHRLRKRYGELLRTVVAETVSSKEDLDEEMRYLVAVLRGQ
jgi:RNA polymerase sigma factor (sigma-70 family)